MYQRHSGFTLIELIIVIVILGLLAVTAAPRFIDISSDAKAASLQGLKSAIQGANQLVYSKALIQNLQSEESADVLLSDGSTVSTRYGYIAYDDSDRRNGADQLTSSINFTICHHQASASECADADWLFDIDDGHIQFYHIREGEDPSGGNGSEGEPLCYLEYTLPTSEGDTPSYTIQDSEC